MSRVLCQQCHRPIKTCICHFTTQITNHISVIILQHPNEVSQTKGSLTLLENSLNKCTVIVGENFSENEQLNQLLTTYNNKIYLLYPHEKAITLALDHKEKNTINNQVNKTINTENACLILIDATWKKAYRIFMLSKNLHSLIKLQLPQGIQSYYAIRKTSVVNGLSTLEACCYALSFLEKDETKYQLLINNFKNFNQFLLTFKHKYNRY
jgi:DTW domain-containing protein YfiP